MVTKEDFYHFMVYLEEQPLSNHYHHFISVKCRLEEFKRFLSFFKFEVLNFFDWNFKSLELKSFLQQFLFQ